MYFVITTRLGADTIGARAAATPEHRAYLVRNASQILAVGPTIGEDGVTPIGSVYLFECANRSEAEHFVADDPMTLAGVRAVRSEEHTSELQSLMRISYAVFCLKKKNK